MMISLEAQEVGVEDEFPLLVVGFSESTSQEGRDFFFQCDLRMNNYVDGSNWPQGESYCVTNEEGRTRYGGVLEAEFRGDVLRVLFNEATVTALRLADAEFEIRVATDDVDLAEIKRQLGRVLTCGRPEYHPRLLELQGEDS